MTQKTVSIVERMAQVASPLIVLNWPEVGGRVMIAATYPGVAAKFFPISEEPVKAKGGQCWWDFECFPTRSLSAGADARRIDPQINFKWLT